MASARDWIPVGGMKPPNKKFVKTDVASPDVPHRAVSIGRIDANLRSLWRLGRTAETPGAPSKATTGQPVPSQRRRHK